jgi:hypothetical protein
LKKPNDFIYIINPEDGGSSQKQSQKGVQKIFASKCVIFASYLKKVRIIVGDIPVEFGGILWVHLPCTFRRLTVEPLGTSTLIVPISAN